MDYNNEEIDTLEEDLKNGESITNPEEFQKEIESMAASTSSGYQLPVDAPITKPEGQMKKTVWEFIKKHPAILGGILIAFVIILAIVLFLQGKFDFVGIGDTTPKEYQGPACGKVYLTWEKESYTKAHEKDPDYEPITDPTLVDLENEERFEYEEYGYEDFVAGVIWTDNKNAEDVDNQVVYEAMAIAARSRLIATLPNNCVVLKYYNEQAASFTELTGSEEKYNEITTAVGATQGIIMGRKKQILNARYEPFSYVSKRRDKEDKFKKTFFYRMAHENKEQQQLIPASWVVEIEEKKGKEIPKTKVGKAKKLESMSLYGAKYLLELTNKPYELYRTLEYYYGRDIEYYKIDSTGSFGGGSGLNFGSSGCMWWPIGSNETTVENGVTFAKGAPASTRITSFFGNRDQPDVEGASTNHKAIDIGGPTSGYPAGVINIIAAADGTVTKTTSGGSLGNGIYIKHADGTITRYGHLHSVFVSQGENVKQGQVIGKMGSTGVSTATHLDFQVVVNSTAVNPLNYVSASLPDSRKECVTSGGITQGNDNTQTICLTLKNNGYSNNAIAAMMGNMEAESGFSPTIVNSIGCVGIVQWCGRGNTLKSIYGSEWNVLDNQLEFLIYELNTSFLPTKSYLLGNNSAGDMMNYFCMHFEIPGESECRKRQNYYSKWVTYANNGCK